MDLVANERERGVLHGARVSRMRVGAGVVVPALLLYEGFVFEWNYYVERLDPLRSLFPLAYAYVNPALFFLVPAAVLLAGSRRRGHRAERRYTRFGWYAVAVMVAILLIQKLVKPPGMTTPSLSAYLLFFSWPLWIRVGMQAGVDDARAEVLLLRLARLSVAASAFSLILQVLQFSPMTMIGPMHWSYSIIVMFGAYYYLAQGIVGSGSRMRALCGFICCSIVVVGPLSKRLLFGFGSGLLVFTVLLLLHGAHSNTRFLKKAVGRAVVLVGLLVAASAIMADRLVGYFDAVVQASWFYGAQYSAADLLNFDASVAEALASGRFEIWRDMWPRLLASPWIGVGLSPFYGDGIVSHNGFLDMLLAVGVVGAGVCVIGTSKWLWAVLQSRVPRRILALQLACVAFVGGVLGVNMGISVWLLFNTVNAYLCLVMGVVLGLAIQVRDDEPSALSIR